MWNRSLYLSLLLTLAMFIVACGNKHESYSPAGPTTTTAALPPTINFAQVGVQKVGRVAEGNNFYVQLYGNLNVMLDTATSIWSGATIYVRQYRANGNREAWVVQWANSTPFGNTNVTLIRDIVSDGRPDFDILVALKDVAGKELPRVPFTYPNRNDRSRFMLVPENVGLSINGDNRTQGPMPGIGIQSVGIHAESMRVSDNEAVVELSDPNTQSFRVLVDRPDGSVVWRDEEYFANPEAFFRNRGIVSRAR